MADANRKQPAVECGPDLPSAGTLWERVLLRAARSLASGHLRLQLPNGALHDVKAAAPGPLATLVVRDARAVRKLMTGGVSGFAAAYMDGDWETPDLPALLALAHVNETALSGYLDGIPVVRWGQRLRHRMRRNSRGGSRRNIAYHYDLGNAFYAPWLDPGMSYSSALFTDSGQNLEAAQQEKYRRLARTLDLRPGNHVLEIGCGWGAFAVMAARDYGCTVTAITLSREQQAFAQQRVQAAGLADRVQVRLQDYRDVRGTFDRIASIEMFEAVGEAYWPLYLRLLRDRLAPDGIAALQVITIAEDRFAKYRRSADFIQTYVFPGGMLPAPSVFAAEAEDAGLTIGDTFTFGASYAETLARWRRAFDESWLAIASLGFDERFRRLWTFYLSYCEVGFRTGATDVAQYQLRRS